MIEGTLSQKKGVVIGMNKIIFTLLILCFLLSGCTSNEVIEEKLVMGRVVNKGSRLVGKITNHYVTVKYNDIKEEFNNFRLYNIVNIGDEVQVIYVKYRIMDKDNSSIGYSLELPY